MSGKLVLRVGYIRVHVVSSLNGYKGESGQVVITAGLIRVVKT